jgi:hypothetical protein
VLCFIHVASLVSLLLAFLYTPVDFFAFCVKTCKLAIIAVGGILFVLFFGSDLLVELSNASCSYRDGQSIDRHVVVACGLECLAWSYTL